ncbi:MAG: AAA family ATPase [Rhodospirillales bacterium]|nr:AAA family ATPase [Rhodospirillales bacterium]
MECPRCGAIAPDRYRFCGECGTPLPWRCTGCGTANLALSRVCSACGSPTTGVPAPARIPAERRQVTVMFCDLVNSTALGARLDLEDLRDVMTAYQDRVTRIVGQFGGYVARYMGDGALIYFGYPAAHEDDAERAVRAGLAITHAVAGLRTQAVAAGSLAARVGIATGLVVVGDAIGMGLSSEQAIIGDTPNLAARLQGIADPGTVVIASGTRDLIGALFELQARPPSQLKGYPVPVPSWTVIQESEIDSRFEALRSGHTHALLGRQAELACLRDGWARARDGAGRVVVLSGEPGIGKSRLIAALEEELRAEPFVRLRYLCAPLYQDTALHPIAAQIGRAARFRNDDTPSLRRRKLDHLLTALRTPAADRATFAALLGLLPEDDPELQRLTPARRKERTFAAILAQLDVLAEAGPVMVVVEDLHWADATTRELLDRLVESVVTRRILLVVTSRPLPQGQHLLPPGPSVQHCVLKRLERPDALVLLEQVVGRDRLPLPAREQILAHADGVPLFLEELARSTVEAPAPDPTGRGGMPPIHVPTSLHASLTARLDRLPGSREIAQMAAELGRDFAAETFRAMFLVPEERLQTALRALVDADLLVAVGRPPNVVYSFRHALVQDAAYGSLLREPRRALHRQVADALAQEAAEPEVIAQHYAEAGLPDRAIDFHLRAASLAMSRCAVQEMVSQLRRGLALLEQLPDKADTSRRELQLQTELGRGLIDAVGSGSEEAHDAFLRAHTLALALDDTAHMLPILYGLQVYHFTNSQPEIVVRYAEEILALGERTADRRALVLGERVAGSAYLLLGRFADCRRAYENLLRLYDVTLDGGASADTPRDPFVAGCAFLGICLTVMGHSAQGRMVEGRGLRHADALGHAISTVFSLRRGCLQHMLTRDLERVRTLAGRLLSVTAEYETFLGGPEGTFFESWVRLQETGDHAQHARMLAALRQLDEAKIWAMLPYLMAAAAEASAACGMRAEAELLIARAVALVELTEERWCEPEVLRIQALLTPAEARPLLERALEQARRQGARLWELRLGRDLARHLLADGAAEQARALVREVCDGFVEGRDMPDFHEAMALLDAVGA